MTEKKVYGWHFSESERLAHYDNRPIKVGVTNDVTNKLKLGMTAMRRPVICGTALHASVRAIDALMNAPGNNFAWRVYLHGAFADPAGYKDKMAASHRTPIAGVDARGLGDLVLRDMLGHVLSTLVAELKRRRKAVAAANLDAIDINGKIGPHDVAAANTALEILTPTRDYYTAMLAVRGWVRELSMRSTGLGLVRSAGLVFTKMPGWPTRDEINEMLEARLYEALGITAETLEVPTKKAR